MNTTPRSSSKNERTNNMFFSNDMGLLRKRNFSKFTIMVVDDISADVLTKLDKFKRNYFIHKDHIEVEKEWEILPSLPHEVIIKSGTRTIRLEPYYKYTVFEQGQFSFVHYLYLSKELNESINAIKKTLFQKYKFKELIKHKQIFEYKVNSKLLHDLTKSLTTSMLELTQRYKNNFLFLYREGDEHLFMSSCLEEPILCNNTGWFNSWDFGLYCTDPNVQVVDEYLMLWHKGRRTEALKVLVGKSIPVLKEIAKWYTEKIQLDIEKGILDE